MLSTLRRLFLFAHLPDLVMIISVPIAWNRSHNSLLSSLTTMFGSLFPGTPGTGCPPPGKVGSKVTGEPKGAPGWAEEISLFCY